MSILSILKSYWSGRAISVRAVVDIFEITESDARIRLQELAYEKEVLKEVKNDVFIGVGNQEKFENAFRGEFSDCIDNDSIVEDISNVLYSE